MAKAKISKAEKIAVICAGGTGGHLFPAQALAVELKKRGWTIDLATDERVGHFEFPARNIHIISSDTFRSRNPFSMARTLIRLGRGFLKARKMLRDVKPAIVVGFGGYPTLPPLRAAITLKIPTLIHEANAVLGRANRVLMPQVSAIGLAAEETALLDETFRGKTRVVGVPVRAKVLEVAKTAYKAPPAKGAIRILVFGGSQGARVFADVVPSALGMLPAALRARIDLTQQVRQEDAARVTAALEPLGLKAHHTAAFFDDMHKRLSAAHVVICRSGASTVNELTVLGRPSILVPLPHAIDSDQLRNAQNLEKSGAAILVEQKFLSPERLSALLFETLQDPLWMESRAKAAKSIGRPDAVKLLADFVEDTAAKP